MLHYQVLGLKRSAKYAILLLLKIVTLNLDELKYFLCYGFMRSFTELFLSTIQIFVSESENYP